MFIGKRAGADLAQRADAVAAEFLDTARAGQAAFLAVAAVAVVALLIASVALLRASR